MVKLDILGPSRYKAYLQGIEVTSFVKDGRVLTLEELGIDRATREDLFAMVDDDTLMADNNKYFIPPVFIERGSITYSNLVDAINNENAYLKQMTINSETNGLPM